MCSVCVPIYISPKICQASETSDWYSRIKQQNTEWDHFWIDTISEHVHKLTQYLCTAVISTSYLLYISAFTCFFLKRELGVHLTLKKIQCANRSTYICKVVYNCIYTLYIEVLHIQKYSYGLASTFICTRLVSDGIGRRSVSSIHHQQSITDYYSLYS